MAEPGANGSNLNGDLAFALVNAAAPDYSGDEGKVRPLSVNTDGELRVDIAGATFDLTTAGTIGAIDDAAKPDSTQDATVIAGVKGVNANLTSLLNKNAGKYETVAKSQTAQVLGGAGAVGDFIKRIIIIPETTAPGLVTLLDNAISIPLWLGGTVGADLKPIQLDLDMVSVSGAWKITTGDHVNVIAIGKFT